MYVSTGDYKMSWGGCCLFVICFVTDWWPAQSVPHHLPQHPTTLHRKTQYRKWTDGISLNVSAATIKTTDCAISACFTFNSCLLDIRTEKQQLWSTMTCCPYFMECVWEDDGDSAQAWTGCAIRVFSICIQAKLRHWLCHYQLLHVCGLLTLAQRLTPCSSTYLWEKWGRWMRILTSWGVIIPFWHSTHSKSGSTVPNWGHILSFSYSTKIIV